MSRLHRLFRSYAEIMMDVTLTSNSDSDWQAFPNSESTKIFHLTNGLLPPALFVIIYVPSCQGIRQSLRDKRFSLSDI